MKCEPHALTWPSNTSTSWREKEEKRERGQEKEKERKKKKQREKKYIKIGRARERGGRCVVSQ